MKQNPFSGDIRPSQLAGMMRDPSRIAGFLTQEVPGVGSSGAAIFADIVNVQRADLKRLAEAHDVDVEIKRMSEDRAASLLAGVVEGEGHKVVEVFNSMAEKRDKILRDALEEEEYKQFMAAKTQIMLTDEPDTFGTDVDQDGETIEELEGNGGDGE